MSASNPNPAKVNQKIFFAIPLAYSPSRARRSAVRIDNRKEKAEHRLSPVLRFLLSVGFVYVQ
jgi:hypothetical protein